MRRMALGIIAALAGTSIIGSSSLAHALDEAPDLPFGWHYAPSHTRSKSRPPGSRAHRRWRKRRASGRA